MIDSNIPPTYTQRVEMRIFHSTRNPCHMVCSSLCSKITRNKALLTWCNWLFLELVVNWSSTYDLYMTIGYFLEQKIHLFPAAAALNPCADFVTPYLNTPAVKAALHVLPDIQWTECKYHIKPTLFLQTNCWWVKDKLIIMYKGRTPLWGSS